MEKFLLDHKIWLELMVAVGTLGATLIALYPTIDKFLMKIKIDFWIGEKIGFVISSGNKLYKIHLGFGFINQTNKELIINRVVIKISHQNQNYTYDWNMFIKDIDGTNILSDKRPVPIILLPRTSHYEMIQFFISPEQDLPLTVGKWKLETCIWVNKESIVEKPNFVKFFEFRITQEKINSLNTEKQNFKKQNFQVPCPIIHFPMKNWNIDEIL